MTGLWMLAEVRLALDTIGLNGRFDFDCNCWNDLIVYLPYGSKTNGGPS